jgi:hypothetical protein
VSFFNPSLPEQVKSEYSVSLSRLSQKDFETAGFQRLGAWVFYQDAASGYRLQLVNSADQVLFGNQIGVCSSKVARTALVVNM